MSHTPGPWKQGGKHGHNAGTIYAPSKDDAIAAVYGIPMHTMIHDVPERYAEGMANARLIASAPDLLALVERYASECGECGGKGFRMTHPAGAIGDCFECADIRTAINAARGK